MARLPPSRHSLHGGLRIPDLRARDDSPLNRSCHQSVPAICLTRRLPAQRIRRCGPNATFRTRLQQCEGDWWPLSPRCYRVAHAARLGTDTEICDTVRLMHCSKSQRYSITLSAMASSDAGTSKPSALAVLRLMTSSYLVGACTERSAGFAPLRMRSTYPAACRYWSTSPGP